VHPSDALHLSDALHPSDAVHLSEEGDRSRISTSMKMPITTRLASNANADLIADLSNEARSARRRLSASAAAVCRWDAAVPLRAC
jgi:hypothetical protein